MVKTYESWIPPSPNLDKVTVTFDELNNTDLFHQMQAAYSVHFWLSKNKDFILVQWLITLTLATWLFA